MLACICVPPGAVRSHRGWPRDVTPAPAQVTLSRTRAPNTIYTAAQSEHGFPSRQGLPGFSVAVGSTRSAPGAQEGVLLGQQIIRSRSQGTSGDAVKTTRWAPREHVKAGEEAEAPAGPPQTKGHRWGVRRGADGD